MQTIRKADIWIQFGRQIARDVRGQDLIEYSLLAGMVAVAAAAIFPSALMPNISRIYSKIESIMSQSNSFG